MNVARKRKLDARALRLGTLSPAVNTVVKVPQPKNLNSKEEVKVKSPVVTESIKRGRGRPKKVESEKIDSKKNAISGNKKLASAKGRK